jgi:hypothetical protein
VINFILAKFRKIFPKKEKADNVGKSFADFIILNNGLPDGSIRQSMHVMEAICFSVRNTLNISFSFDKLRSELLLIHIFAVDFICKSILEEKLSFPILNSFYSKLSGDSIIKKCFANVKSDFPQIISRRIGDYSAVLVNCRDGSREEISGRKLGQTFCNNCGFNWHPEVAKLAVDQFDRLARTVSIFLKSYKINI